MTRAPGRAWVFGDAVDTDLLAPGDAMKLPPDALARQCLRAVAPRFAHDVRPGDVIVAGTGFGIGSSREQAAESLKRLGVAAILARSYGRIFWRNAINLGLPALVLPLPADIADGDAVEVDVAAARWTNLTRATDGLAEPLAEHLLDILARGGLLGWLERRPPQTEATGATA